MPSVCACVCELRALTASGEGLAVVEPFPLLGHRQCHDGDGVLGSQEEARERVRLVNLQNVKVMTALLFFKHGKQRSLIVLSDIAMLLIKAGHDTLRCAGYVFKMG